MMRMQLILVLVTLLQCGFLHGVRGACETEDDLDFETCDLKDLKEEALVVRSFMPNKCICIVPY